MKQFNLYLCGIGILTYTAVLIKLLLVNGRMRNICKQAVIQTLVHTTKKVIVKDQHFLMYRGQQTNKSTKKENKTF